jgi:hypothetical protein
MLRLFRAIFCLNLGGSIYTYTPLEEQTSEMSYLKIAKIQRKYIRKCTDANILNFGKRQRRVGHLCAPSGFALIPTGLVVSYAKNNNNNKFHLAMKALDRGIEV